jgi:hypothetical protein
MQAQWHIQLFGELQAQRGDAVRLLGAARALREEIGWPLNPRWQVVQEERLTVLRAAVGEEPFSACWEAGRSLSIEQATAEALGEDDSG